jgi:hypothetical protein
LLTAFLAVAFPIHVWSILTVLREIPAWILRLDAWDTLGVFAYTQVFALLESLLALLPFVLAAFILPARLLRERFVAVTAGIVALTSVWVILLLSFEKSLRSLGNTGLLLAGLVALVSVAGLYLLTLRSTKVAQGIASIAQRLGTLSAIYILVDMLSLAIVVTRNIQG